MFNIPSFFEFTFCEKISNITCLGDICCHSENFTTVPNVEIFNENYIRNYDMSELISRSDHNETECIYEQNYNLLPSDLRLNDYYKLVSMHRGRVQTTWTEFWAILTPSPSMLTTLLLNSCY